MTRGSSAHPPRIEVARAVRRKDRKSSPHSREIQPAGSGPVRTACERPVQIRRSIESRPEKPQPEKLPKDDSTEGVPPSLRLITNRDTRITDAPPYISA